MKPTFKQFSPSELYVPISNDDSLEADNDDSSLHKGYRTTGSSFFDTFMHNLFYKGRLNATVHARLLGLEYQKMCVAVQVITGMSYTRFVDEYIILFANDLLQNKPRKMQLKEVSARLGFGTYSGFYHFMISHQQWQKGKSY